MYLTTGIRAIGTLTIDKEKINVKKNFAPKFLCFQHEISVNLTDIEFIEFKIDRDDPNLEVPLKDLKLKQDILLGCIIRDGSTIIPHGEDMLKAGDTALVATINRQIARLEDIFAD